MVGVDFKNRRLSRLRLGKRGPWYQKIVLAGVLCLSVGILLGAMIGLPWLHGGPSNGPAFTDRIESPSAEREPHVQVVEGRIKTGSTFFQSLMREDVPHGCIDVIISKLKPLLNFRKIQGGTFCVHYDDRGELIKFVYEEGPTEVYEVWRDEAGYAAQKVEVPLTVKLTHLRGEIRSSLFEAVEALGEEDTLAIDFAEILAWEIDFYKDVQEGDRFTVIVEKKYKEKEFIRYGAIRAIEYRGEGKSVVGIRYGEDYYDEEGKSLRKAFLKSPLRFNRISSRFSRARKHPILGGVRPHYGIDYAAPIGTPIWAVADGTVGFCGWNGGYGRQVVLSHMNGYRTHYGHLSRYGRGIRVGKKVKQKETIGYVGSSGLSTGPHLDYRLSKNGQFRNPLKEHFPRGDSIKKEEKAFFERTRDEMVLWLQKGISGSS